METTYDGIYCKMNNTGISQNIFLFSYGQETQEEQKNGKQQVWQNDKMFIDTLLFTSRILNSIFYYMNYCNAVKIMKYYGANSW